MDTDLVGSVLSMKQAATREAAQFSILRKQHEMQMSLINMIDEVARSAPPPGQGAQVDKLA